MRAGHTRERVEDDHDVLADLDESACPLEHHLRDFDVPFRRLVEAGRDYFTDTPRDGLAHLFRPFIDE